MIPAINDFIESYAYIGEVMKKTKLPYTAANINIDYLQFAPYNIVKTNGIKIGIIGLVPIELLSKYLSLPKDLLIDDYDKAVKEVLKKLEKETDVNILSIHTKNYRDIKKLVAFNPKISIVINSNSENLSFSASAINSYDVPVIELGNKGEFAIIVRMEITKGKAKAVDVKYSRLDQKIIEHGAILKYLYEYQDNFGM
jgi:2',3'-cyclic-nucleotide 2'-phosphodiesterase (5'-nucleotidase family)